MKLATTVFAVLWAGSTLACSAPDTDPVGTGAQALCGGFTVTQLAARAGTIFFVSPESLATATDGWGPQALSLSVAQGFSTQTSYTVTPSVSSQLDDITRSLSRATGFNVTNSITLIAATTVLVPTDAYFRIEAYPEYEVIDWTLRADACDPPADFFITTGSIYRPVGVHFRALTLVGDAWSALNPPSIGELAGPPPWAFAAAGAGAPLADAGAPSADAGAATSPPAMGAATSPPATGTATSPAGTGAATSPGTAGAGTSGSATGAGSP